MSSRCHYCQGELTADVMRRNRLCPHCASDLHCCKNCPHFSDSLTTKCNEPESPWISDRNIDNQCEFFEFRVTNSSATTVAADNGNEAEAAKAAFRALFRNA